MGRGFPFPLNTLTSQSGAESLYPDVYLAADQWDAALPATPPSTRFTNPLNARFWGGFGLCRAFRGPNWTKVEPVDTISGKDAVVDTLLVSHPPLHLASELAGGLAGAHITRPSLFQQGGVCQLM